MFKVLEANLLYLAYKWQNFFRLLDFVYRLIVLAHPTNTAQLWRHKVTERICADDEFHFTSFSRKFRVGTSSVYLLLNHTRQNSEVQIIFSHIIQAFVHTYNIKHNYKTIYLTAGTSKISHSTDVQNSDKSTPTSTTFVPFSSSICLKSTYRLEQREHFQFQNCSKVIRLHNV